MQTFQKDFLSYIASERAHSANTLSAYGRDLDQFALFCTRKKIDFRAITLRQLREFLASLRRGGNAERSIARKASTLKQFYQFCLRENGVTADPTELLSVRVKKHVLPKILTNEEIVALVESANGPGEQETRDRAMLELWYATGARVSEIALLKAKNLDWADGLVRIKGKGGTERIVPLSQAALTWCQKYREIRVGWLRRFDLKDPDSFFLTIRGKGFTRQGIWKLLKKYVKRAGITRRVWPHMIRHTFATEMLHGGADLRVVQDLLGHKSISTTEVYTHLDIENLKSMQVKYHPRR
ncbi:MAG: tyrosine recombinase [Deltaproteobacteria bacterium]|nr:tyrosine recombinase [Deltaproteobacteria bacterium]MBI3295008.1 tyrosine recombinase [Deltaproteobacteria bacterium]